MKNDPRSCERDLRNCVRSLKKIQDFNGIWTLDLSIPVRRSSSNQLSYEATDVFSGQVCVHMFPFSSLSREHMNSYFTSSQHQWLHSIASVSRGHGFKSRWSPGFFSGFSRNCINWVHNSEDHSSFDLISAVLIFDSFHIHVTMMKSWFVNLM